MASVKTTRVLAALLALSTLLGCSEKIGSPADYEDQCVESTLPTPETPPAPSEGDRATGTIDSGNALWDTVSFQSSSRVSGTIPAPDLTAISGEFISVPEFIVWDESTIDVPFTITEAPEGMEAAAMFVQAEGASSYFAVPLSADSSSVKLWGPWPAEGVALPLIDAAWAEPSDGDPQKFNLNVLIFFIPEGSTPPDFSSSTFEGADTANRWQKISFGDDSSVAQLVPQGIGSGQIQVTLLWDQPNDLDLWVTEPSGEVIKWDNPTSSGVQRLDRDDTDGYGAENVRYIDDAADGAYKIEVDYYLGSTNPEGKDALTTNFAIIVKGCGESRSINGVLSEAGENSTVLSFNFGLGCTLNPATTPTTPDFFQEVGICDAKAQTESDNDLTQAESEE